MTAAQPTPRFPADLLPARHTRNSPLKEVLASCEVTPAWPQVLDKLAEGRVPADQVPTFLQELAREKVLARK